MDVLEQWDPILAILRLKNAKKTARRKLQEIQKMEPNATQPSSEDKAKVDLILLHFWSLQQSD